ncbi:MAG: ATP synthase F1 subunit gamma [Tissierella sp.]|uniref:ATP synthase F1 subunit gamma n=1 Tax=Tissierella sp. TaxID=41274 RepID=UPI003F96F1BC
MAQSTREIKRRIKGIGSTKQITKAMELVSSAKMRKRRIMLDKTRPYYNTVLENIKEVLENVNVNHTLLKQREVKNALYIIINGDKGLAGGYNSNINRLIHKKFKNDKDSISLITVGAKSKDFFKGRDYNIIESFVGISEDPKFTDAKKIGNLAMELFKKEEVDEINVVYTDFITTLSYKPTILKLLPSEKIKKEDSGPTTIVDFEPTPEEVLEFLIPKYIESSIFGALIEASTSEQAARMTAMSAATDNANDIIDELNMEYNRARQSAITIELSEIVAGAEALK